MSSLATFSVNGTRFAVPAELVQEVVLDPQISPVPRAPQPLAGLVNLRGRIVAVLSLPQRLGFEAGDPNVIVVLDLSDPVALLVDRYHDVVDPSGCPASPPPPTLAEQTAECIKQVWQLADELVCELDLDRAIPRT